MRPFQLFTLVLLAASLSLNAAVPDPRFRKPAVPGFLQPMEFRTVMMQTFPSEVSGMVPDPVSDLIWNPATLAGLSKRSVFLDFFGTADNPVFAASAASSDPAANARSWTDEFVAPRWYPGTSVVSSETRPLVSVGLLLPLSRRLSAAVFDRVMFDYGPFLQSMSGGGNWNAETADANYYDKARDVTLSRLETGHNQQTAVGNRIEAVIGWRASDRLDLGLRLGHMFYRKDGELLEDDWANYPHSSSAGLEDESLTVRGSQFEAGLGAMFRADSTFRFGVYGGLISGDGSERSAALDTTAGWSEQDTDPRYFSRSASFLTADQSYDAEGVRPIISANAEKRFSENWLMRAFVSYSWSETDVEGALASADTTSGDRGYDYLAVGFHFLPAHPVAGQQGQQSGRGRNRKDGDVEGIRFRGVRAPGMLVAVRRTARPAPAIREGFLGNRPDPVAFPERPHDLCAGIRTLLLSPYATVHHGGRGRSVVARPARGHAHRRGKGIFRADRGQRGVSAGGRVVLRVQGLPREDNPALDGRKAGRRRPGNRPRSNASIPIRPRSSPGSWGGISGWCTATRPGSRPT